MVEVIKCKLNTAHPNQTITTHPTTTVMSEKVVTLVNNKKSSMNKFFATLICLFVFVMLSIENTKAQQATRPSPAATASGKVGEATITINYSSPAVKGRTVWGDLVPYGKVWRAGANEATSFEVSQDVVVQGKTLPAGKYAFFVIPTEKDWTVIFNKVANQWGAYDYKESEDALRVTAVPRKSTALNERLTYRITKDGIVLSWENLELPITIK